MCDNSTLRKLDLVYLLSDHIGVDPHVGLRGPDGAVPHHHLQHPRRNSGVACPCAVRVAEGVEISFIDGSRMSAVDLRTV